MEVIQQDTDMMQAYRAMNEPLLHKMMEEAKESDNKLAGYKLAVSTIYQYRTMRLSST